MKTFSTHRVRSSVPRVAALALAALFLGACSDGDNGARGPAGPAGPPGPSGGGTSGGVTDNQLLPSQPSPGVNVEILDLGGASLEAGVFLPGDTLSITYSLTKDDGSSWDPAEFNRLRALVSGPTFNYQRVIGDSSGPLTESVDNGDGTYTYTFPDPIPDEYLPPLNDGPAFGYDDGDWGGTALVDGTYTVALYGRWEYYVGETRIRDVGNATFDFLVGSAGPIEPRAVSATANCNTCHDVLQAHGGQRRELTLCLMCHTAGGEDEDIPGVSIDFRVMIHKIHNGEHLPSVLGVATNADGSRNYAATPVDYEVGGHEYSHVAFPTWPSLQYPTLRDEGYSALSSAEKGLEDDIRSGVVACHKCHGDPDGVGPVGAPADGDLAFDQPSRNACGSCHDDIDWDLPYVANSQTMQPQPDNANCKLCHLPSGSGLSVEDAHLHPVWDTDNFSGVVFGITDVNGGVNLEAGDKLLATFTIQTSDGVDIPAGDLNNFNVGVSGPTDNMQALLYTSFPTSALSGGQPYVTYLPEPVRYEYLGASTVSLSLGGGPGNDVFTTSRTPLWDDLGAATAVYAVDGYGDGSTTLASAAMSSFQYIDVDDSANFERGEYIVIDEGTADEEYHVIQFVDDNRLWFSSLYTSSFSGPSPLGNTPASFGLRYDHAASAVVDEVTLDALEEGTDFDVDPVGGEITEVLELGNGVKVLASYTTDFVMPATYGVPFNGGADLDETNGVWTGKSLASGTYRLHFWGYKSVTVNKFGESNSLRDLSMDGAFEFLVGDADSLQPYDLIDLDPVSSCYRCHDELRFHGGGRGGFDTCISCHGVNGAEDRPQYVAANAGATTGVGVNFRQMIHKIHMGAELANKDTYTVNGFGSGYPNNFSAHMYDEVEFPAFPDGVKACHMCHGEDNEAWTEPRSVSHPTEQDVPGRRWFGVCSSCHDSDDQLAHIDVMTAPSGAESCGVCHGPGKEQAVDIAHMLR